VFDNGNLAKLTPRQSLEMYGEPTWDTQWERSTGQTRNVGIDMTPALSPRCSRCSAGHLERPIESRSVIGLHYYQSLIKVTQPQ